MADEILDQRVQLLVSRQILAALDDWRRRQSDLPNRSEAIRRLIEQGVKLDRAPRDEN